PWARKELRRRLKSIARGDERSVDELVAGLRVYHEKVKEAYRNGEIIAAHEYINSIHKAIYSLNFIDEGVAYYRSPMFQERILENYSKDKCDMDFSLLCFDIDKKFDRIIRMLKGSLPQNPAKPGPNRTLKSIARGDQKAVDELVAGLSMYHEKVKSALKVRDT